MIGGAGFIGSNLSRRLADLGANVMVVDSLIPQYGGNLFNLQGYTDKITVNLSDIRDHYSLRAILGNKEHIFCLAGQTSHFDSMIDPISDLNINCNAQLSILEILRDVNPSAKVVFASTRQIYGVPQALPVTEDHPIAPVDCNGISKYASEMYYCLYSKLYQLDCTVLRLTNTIGPRMRIADSRQTFVGVWIRNLIEGLPIEVWGGSQLRDFNDVEDVVHALLIAGSRQSKLCSNIYNIGGAQPISLDALAKLMVGIYGKGDIKFIDYPNDRKSIDIGDYYSDYSKFTTESGWEPRVELSESLSKTLNYYAANFHHYLV